MALIEGRIHLSPTIYLGMLVFKELRLTRGDDMLAYVLVNFSLPPSPYIPLHKNYATTILCFSPTRNNSRDKTYVKYALFILSVRQLWETSEEFPIDRVKPETNKRIKIKQILRNHSNVAYFD